VLVAFRWWASSLAETFKDSISLLKDIVALDGIKLILYVIQRNG
jgi:hypothetical protein